MKKPAQVLIAAIAVATLIPAALALTGLDDRRSGLAIYNGPDSSIADARGDATPVQQFSTSIVPEVMGYHDILSAGVKKHDSAYLLTMDLAGDPNESEKYETNYVWRIITEDEGRDHVYTILIPYFAPGSGFEAEGWNYAVFDNAANQYVVNLTRIPEMPANKVELAVQSSHLGDPQSFYYWASVSVRVNNTFLSKPPDYLMDYAP